MPDRSMSLRLHFWDCSCCSLPIFFLFLHCHRPQSLFPTSSVMSFLKRLHAPPLWTLVLYVVVPSGRCRHAVPGVSHLLCVRRSDPGHDVGGALWRPNSVNHYCVDKALLFSTPGQMDCFLVQGDQQLRRWPHAKLRPCTPPAGAWSSACPTCRTSPFPSCRPGTRRSGKWTPPTVRAAAQVTSSLPRHSQACPSDPSSH